MAQKIKFQYFTGLEADLYSFYRIPKILFTNEYFKGLSSDAKILYGLMLDRMSLSIKNQWFDEEQRAYIYFAVEDIMELLNCGKNKALKTIQELDEDTGIGLIEKKRQGMGKANRIYVKKFMFSEDSEAPENAWENQRFTDDTSRGLQSKLQEVPNVNFKKFKNQTSRGLQNKLQEVYISNPNNTNMSNLKESDTESNPIISNGEMDFGSHDLMRYDVNKSPMLQYQGYELLIRQNIDMDSLLLVHPQDKELIEGIYNLILETVLCTSSTIWISSNQYPAELVRSRFLKLTYDHVEYVIHCIHENATEVRNIRKYLLAALFNAPNTMSGYYRTKVNYDMQHAF